MLLYSLLPQLPFDIRLYILDFIRMGVKYVGPRTPASTFFGRFRDDSTRKAYWMFRCVDLCPLVLMQKSDTCKFFGHSEIVSIYLSDVFEDKQNDAHLWLANMIRNHRPLDAQPLWISCDSVAGYETSFESTIQARDLIKMRSIIGESKCRLSLSLDASYKQYTRLNKNVNIRSMHYVILEYQLPDDCNLLHFRGHLRLNDTLLQNRAPLCTQLSVNFNNYFHYHTIQADNILRYHLMTSLRDLNIMLDSDRFRFYDDEIVHFINKCSNLASLKNIVINIKFPDSDKPNYWPFVPVYPYGKIKNILASLQLFTSHGKERQAQVTVGRVEGPFYSKSHDQGIERCVNLCKRVNWLDDSTLVFKGKTRCSFEKDNVALNVRYFVGDA